MMSNDKKHHEDNVFPFSMGKETKLKEVLENLCEDETLRLFDGEEFIDPADVLDNTEDADFLDLAVRSDEFGIYDLYVQSDEPLFSYALPCPSCGKYVEVPTKDESNPEDFCECKKE
jgi:hypothetical protein